jgi:peptidoglycan/LPS O-acetylase OafA/YrhL
MGTIDRSAVATDFIPIVAVLRAIAISFVVVYHVIPAQVPGGLVGVDVFFVISGFLILGNIWKSVREARFSLIAFFERRALRIIPPYAILIVVSSIAACFILVTPQELADFRRDFILYSDVLGYFDDTASCHALLHLWWLAFCGEQWCAPVKGNIALFSDHDHLSAAGTELLISAGGDDFEWAASAAP